MSSINVRESFELLVDIMRFLEESTLILYIGLGNKFCCACKDENISAMIYGTDDLILNPNKVGVFKYGDFGIIWRMNDEKLYL